MKVVKIKYIRDYIVEITSATGIVFYIDLKNFLNNSTNSIIRKYLDKKLFSQVYIDGGAPTWNNGEFDLNPSSLHQYKVRVSSIHSKNAA